MRLRSISHVLDQMRRNVLSPRMEFSRVLCVFVRFFFFSSRRRHTRCSRDWSSDVCSSDLNEAVQYVLSPKLEPEDSAVAQQRPGVTLSWRRVVAQLAGARKSLGRAETTKRIHLPERAAQRNDLRNQNPAEGSEKKTHPSFPLSRRERGSGGEDPLAGQGGPGSVR